MTIMESHPLPPTSQGIRWGRWLPLAALAVLMGFAYAMGWHTLLTPEGVVAVEDHFHAQIEAAPVLAAMVFALAYLLVVALSLPGASIFTIAGGFIFGLVPGGVLSVIGATIGACLLFLVARSALGDGLARKAGPQAAKLQAGFQEDALNYMLFLRLVPAFPFFIVNVVPALLGVPFRTYVIGTLFGIIPGTLAFSSIGAGLESVVRAAKADQALCLAAKAAGDCKISLHLSHLFTWELKLALALMSVLALLPVALKYWRRRHGR